MDHLIRTRLAKDIIAEVAFPERQTGKVALVCGGAPSTPPNKKVLEFLAKHGYVAFGIRYRGTWESEGNFLEHSPTKDVAEVMKQVVKHQGIVDAWSREKKSIKVQYFDLLGASFGGPAVLLNSKNKYVRKVIALAPVIDFRKCGPGESMEDYIRFSKEGFGGAYRVKDDRDWGKLLRKDFYNPLTMTRFIDAEKCFIIQNLDDDVCIPENLRALETKVPVSVYYKRKGGHLGTNKITQKFYWNKIEAFLRKSKKLA